MSDDRTPLGIRLIESPIWGAVWHDVLRPALWGAGLTAAAIAVGVILHDW